MSVDKIGNSIFKLSPILHSFYDSKIFCNSIQNNINNSTIIGDNIFFYTYDDTNSENVFSYERAYIVCESLIKQIKYLHNAGYSFIHLELNDILYINKKSSIIANFKNICKINKICNGNCNGNGNDNDNDNDNFNITINYPIIKSKFSSPSILAIKTIPCHISYTSFYYSLALIILYKMDLSIEKLYLIHNTKLYWILKKWITP